MFLKKAKWTPLIPSVWLWGHHYEYELLLDSLKNELSIGTNTWDLVCFSSSFGSSLCWQLSWPFMDNIMSSSNLKLCLMHHWPQVCCQTLLLWDKAHRPSQQMLSFSLPPSTKKLSLSLLFLACSLSPEFFIFNIIPLSFFIFKISPSRWDIYCPSKAWPVSFLCLVNEWMKK